MKGYMSLKKESMQHYYSIADTSGTVLESFLKDIKTGSFNLIRIPVFKRLAISSKVFPLVSGTARSMNTTDKIHTNALIINGQPKPPVTLAKSKKVEEIRRFINQLKQVAAENNLPRNDRGKISLNIIHVTGPKLKEYAATYNINNATTNPFETLSFTEAAEEEKVLFKSRELLLLQKFVLLKS